LSEQTITRLLKTREVAKLAGITYRQIDHWVRDSKIQPTQPSLGSGDARLWNQQDAAKVVQIAEYYRHGYQLDKAVELVMGK